ncbi:septation protein A [Burkholderiaceae bacterium DAT-1]|nr:septation protein A [Burkholderiaceae bacterium DAT-1]
MKFLFDLLPVVAFFVGYRSNVTIPELGLLKPIEFATALAIVLSVGQIAYLKIKRQPVDMMKWISLGIIVVMGGATILLHDQRFIFWKPTLLYWASAIALLVSRYVFGVSPIKALLGKEIHMEDRIWHILMWVWLAFFVLLGFANLYVAYSFTETFWVNYKLASIGFIPVFFIAQALLLAHHIKEVPTEAPASDAKGE